MKNIYSLSLFLFSFALLGAQDVIYVDHSANGNNDGSTWDHAYTNLNMALSNAFENDEIWVAQGTYLPGANASASFVIDLDLVLLGGFQGNETSSDDRNPELYETILSGDLNQDDIPDDFSTNRDDNVLNVVVVESNASIATLIDGFTISGGHAVGTDWEEVRGGGMYLWGSPVINNCLFTQNFANNSGGAVAFDWMSEGFQITNCHFLTNRSIAGGAILFFGSKNFLLSSSIFEYNETLSAPVESNGGAIFLVNAEGLISDCLFSQNTAEDSGGAVFGWSTDGSMGTEIELNGCSFISNVANAAGGGVAFAPWGDNSTFSIDECNFTSNVSANNGGALVYWANEFSESVSLNVSNSIFHSDTCGSHGGGASILINGSNSAFSLLNCEFDQNTAEAGGGLSVEVEEFASNAVILIDNSDFLQNTTIPTPWGCGSGAEVIMRGANTSFEITNSSFNSNSGAVFGGGMAILGTPPSGTGTALVDSCSFNDNSSGFDAGMYLGSLPESGFFEYVVTNSNFRNNHADTYSGGLDLYSEAPAAFLIDKCTIEENTAGNEGGGICITTNSPGFQAVVQNSIIRNNESPFGAGLAANPMYNNNTGMTQDADVLFQNCLMYGNIGNSTVGLFQTGNIQFLNTTISNNNGIGIQLNDQASATLQNTILHNPNFSGFEALLGGEILMSIGGNLLNDSSLPSPHTSDLLNVVDPLFVGVDDFNLAEGSPAIDKGIDLGNLAEFDLAGNDRVNRCIDIGAYESNFTGLGDCLPTRVKETLSKEILSIYPNPSMDFLNIQLPEAITESVEISIFDAQGRLLKRQNFFEGQSVHVGKLPNGFYSVKITYEESVFAGKFLKQ